VAGESHESAAVILLFKAKVLLLFLNHDGAKLVPIHLRVVHVKHAQPTATAHQHNVPLLVILLLLLGVLHRERLKWGQFQIGHNAGFQAPISTRSAWSPSR